MKNLYLTIILIVSNTLNAQTVEWAYKVLGFSSQLSSPKFSANQVLGKPNTMPDYGFSNCSWTPKTQNSLLDEWIKVAFLNPINVQQIIFAENFNPGAVSKIILYDSAGFEQLVYNKFELQPISEKGRIFNIFIPLTPYKVYALKLILLTDRIPGWNQIDAIGISNSNIPYTLSINLASVTDFKHKPENLGLNVNSQYHELAPVISPDGKTLYFTRDNHPENIGAEKKQDVWFSEVINDSLFTPAKNIGPPINNELNNYILSITPDGNLMLLGNIYEPSSKVKHGVSVSYFDGMNWSFPERLKIKEFYNINKHVAYCLGTDSKTLIMAIERDDSYGDIDLYVSFYDQDDDSWSAPKNLGPIVNTAAEEASPFLAADGITLYYSTSGYPGYGSNDIFITRRLDSTWANWTEPENLGPIINTTGWDAYFTIPASGNYAYFVSTKNSYGAEDIFRIILPNALKPKPVTLIQGRVLNAKTNQPIPARIVYETLPDGLQVGIARSNPLTGTYKIVLPAGNNYAFLAVADGFLAINENLDLRKIHKYQEISRDLFLVPIEHGQIVKLNNIFFELGKYELLPESYIELQRVIEFLKSNPNISIEIRGHTCNIGKVTDNQILSENRAQSVENYLISKGIEAYRLSTVGFGLKYPYVPNTSEENRRKNRRVEFVIIDKSSK